MLGVNPARDCIIITREDGRGAACRLVRNRLREIGDFLAPDFPHFKDEGTVELLFGLDVEQLLRLMGFTTPTNDSLNEVRDYLRVVLADILGDKHTLAISYEDPSRTTVDQAIKSCSYRDHRLRLLLVRT